MDYSYFLLKTGVGIGFLIFLFFNTYFVVEYGKLLGLSGLLKIEEWEKYKTQEPGFPKYPYFLRQTYDNFLTRLVGCPFCIITFLSMGFTLLFRFVVSRLPFTDSVMDGLDIAAIGSCLFLSLELLHKKVYFELK